ncbi:uncharacterized protein B0I36DRAFT_355734 [Microdochium trichocladiopsis]|uniref:BTB domain-containing protein n=1 Tax=Microdochium trichocladiopsis TaxID=1682393 RepID=A0A9P8XUG8_9PEZI|nr:uncharacterized protein B0I36DRAFT_355734 [Microdochium trichocladiopsis]KAH7014539.1 hypothetical protein B0I36DRAFT_355734 [Microdochium trichocladiopsis]
MADTPQQATSAGSGGLSDHTGPVHVLDELGDLWFLVGEGLQTEENPSPPWAFRVCSRTVARSSPVFKTMLFGGWAESKPPTECPNKEWIIRLPEDKPEIMECLLRAMHGDFGCAGFIDMRQPSQVEIIYLTIEHADKYVCLAVLGPWSASWIAACSGMVKSRSWGSIHRLCSLNDRDAEIYPMMAAITYMLGSTEVYSRVMLYMADCYPLYSRKATLYFARCEAFIPDLKDIIKSHRRALLTAVLEPAQDMVFELENGDPEFPTAHVMTHECNTEDEEAECASRNHAVMLHWLQHYNLWPLPSPADAHRLPGVIAASLKDVFRDGRPSDSGPAGEFEFHCPVQESECGSCPWTNSDGFAFEEEYDRFECTLSTGELRFMARQRRLLNTRWSYKL